MERINPNSLQVVSVTDSLRDKYIIKYKDKGLLSSDDINNLTWLGKMALNCDGVRLFIDNGKLDIKEALNLNWEQISALNTKAIQDSINDNSLTLHDALLLTWDEITSIRAEARKKAA